MVFIKTYGRTTILASYSEIELLNKKPNELDKAISEILINAEGIHSRNNLDTLMLKAYYNGDQDIKNKEKFTREEINHKIVENWAYAIVDFKKAYLLGEPIQYTQLNDAGGKEISTLNQYVSYENKDEKDKDLYEDMLVCGRGFRYINKDKEGEEDEAPFEIINCPVENTEVVYSSKLGNEQLFAYIVTPMMYTFQTTGDNGELVTKTAYYDEYTVYLRDKVITYSDKSGTITRIKMPLDDGTEVDEIPLLWGEHIITEYSLNRQRISLIEIGKDLFDNINLVESLDADDFDQYVNAIMVFTNVDVDGEDIASIRQQGAVCINSTDQKKASVDLLKDKINSPDTQVYYNRIKTALFQILGVPIASDTGSVESGDTGKAKLVGQGFATSGIRIKNDMTVFKKSDRNALKVILKICNSAKDSGISSLKVSDINTQFLIDKSENLLVKTQALQTLYACDIPREFANSIVDLFSDSNAVTTAQKDLFGEQISQQNPNVNDLSNESEENVNDDTDKFVNENDKANNQNNKITNTLERNEQGQ